MHAAERCLDDGRRLDGTTALKTSTEGGAPSVSLAAACETTTWSGEYVTGCRRVADAETVRDG